MASGKWWMSSPDKDWAGPRSWATEGGRGEQHQGEKNWSYSAKMDWPTWHWGEVTHRLQAGLELAHTHAYYRRPQRYEHYNEYIKNTDNCIDPWGNEDFSTCSLENWGERRLIRYNGQIMREGEQPVSNFNRPWSARLLLNTEIEAWNLTVGNFLRYRAAYREVV